MTVPDNLIINNTSYWPLFVGPLCGFVAFLTGLCTMEGIFIRPNADGIREFRIGNFYEYLKLPFDSRQRQVAWGYIPNISLLTRLKMLNLNWVAMVGFGTLLSTGYYFFLHK